MHKKILFICTGNSCRSVMAEGLMKDWVEKNGFSGVQVLSAGTGTYLGMPPSEATVEVLKELGVDVEGHVGQPVTPELVNHADWIFCMEQFHAEYVLDMAPNLEDKVHMLRSFGLPESTTETEVPDPIGHTVEMYRNCVKTIQEGIERVGKALEAEKEGTSV